MKNTSVPPHSERAWCVRAHTVAVRRVLFFAVIVMAAADARAQVRTTLRTAAAIRALTRATITAPQPVTASGVVLYVDRIGHHLFIHDGTAGIRVGEVAHPERFKAGDIVDVDGLTSRDGLSPAIAARTVARSGRAPLPPAQRPSTSKRGGGGRDLWREPSVGSPIGAAET